MTQTDLQTGSTEGLSEEQINALLVKHHAAIDSFKGMEAPEQMQLFRALGVDPIAIENYYKGLQEKADTLARQDKIAGQRTNVVGWASFFLGSGGMLIAGKRFSPNIIIRAIVTPIVGAAAWLVGTFAASRLLGGKIREESSKLDMETRDVLVRELAIALENKQQTHAAPQPISSEPVLTETPTIDVPKRDPSFATQAIADKVAAASAEVQRA